MTLIPGVANKKEPCDFFLMSFFFCNFKFDFACACFILFILLALGIYTLAFFPLLVRTNLLLLRSGSTFRCLAVTLFLYEIWLMRLFFFPSQLWIFFTSYQNKMTIFVRIVFHYYYLNSIDDTHSPCEIPFPVHIIFTANSTNIMSDYSLYRRFYFYLIYFF